MRNLFLAAADAARPLLDHPAVRSGWELPSALERMTVGSLTAHLTRAIAVVADNLEKPGSPPARDAAGYFINLMAVPDTDLDSELGISVRSRADAEAEPGIDAVMSRWDGAREALGRQLAETPGDQLIAVRAASMTLVEYLRTRLVELVIHADDLAASLDIAPPEFPEAATAEVIQVLMEIASRRSSPLSVIRALSRVERGDPAVLRVF